MTSLVVEPAPGGLGGRLRVPGDKSISHRALLLAARAEGRSRLRGLSAGADVGRTRRAVAAFGARCQGRPPGPVTVAGGARRLHEPAGVVDVGNSGTAMRLLSGFAAAVDGLTILQGDRSVNGRPMERVVFPLRTMGAGVDGREGGRWPPLAVRGGRLAGIDYRPPVASAQVKGAVLLAGLAAEGATSVTEAVPTRRHTEELLAAAGADVTVTGTTVTVRPSPLQPLDLDIPGDPSQAAFWVVAACLVPGSDLVLEGVYVGPGRATFLDVLRRMGADITVVAGDPGAATADIRVRHRRLAATDVGGQEVPGLIDEIPVLAVAAALAEGTTTFTGAGELRVKESDRIATVASQLAAVGADVEPLADGLVVRGRPALGGGSVSSHGDHRVAMAMAVAGLAAGGPVRIEGWAAVDTSYPGFQEDLHRCLS
ncbi:MAG TPA: 3-phosphoshikimate 1-carboxyvinyltransferase [Acidimicrobiales bacterium]|nr:3-phosphoshikimate 1-carboxyvinyltransferase [Acidimicrobiales bacterium]